MLQKVFSGVVALLVEVEYGGKRLAVLLIRPDECAALARSAFPVGIRSFEICNILWSGESSIMFVVIILVVV